MNNYANSIFAKEHDEYTMIFKNGIRLQNIYDKVRVEAGCSACSILQKNEGVSQVDWKSECKTKGACKKVLEACLKLEENDKHKDEIKDKYAKNVFDFFAIQSPKLLRRKDNAVIEWKDAFGNEFENLDKGMRSSLVALIEESGGRYRLCSE